MSSTVFVRNLPLTVTDEQARWAKPPPPPAPAALTHLEIGLKVMQTAARCAVAAERSVQRGGTGPPCVRC